MQLRDYQERISKEAVERLHAYKIVFLAMEVRTGKTLTALAAAARYGARMVLFVTKKKAIPGIVRDYEAFGFPFGMQVINFESLHKLTVEPDFVIVDESHSIGAYPKPSKRTQALRHIVGSKPLILLSGTPTPESYSQIFHQLWISANTPFHEPTFYRWAKKYVWVKQRMINGYQVNDYSNAKTSSIWSVIEPMMITFSQEDAGFTSLVEEEIHTVVPTPMLKSIFDDIQHTRVIEMQGGQVVSAPTPAILLQKLHQLTGGTVLSDEGERLLIDPYKAHYIWERFAGRHIAIFYKFKAERDLLRSYFENIVETPESFNRDPQSIFIGQYQSAREGINLSSADDLVMMSIDFSAVSYFQARARLQSKDRVKPAKLHWIFGDGLLDEYVYQAVSSKHDFTLRYYNLNTRSR